MPYVPKNLFRYDGKMEWEVTHQTFMQFIVLILFMLGLLVGWLCVFAFSEPRTFVRWFTPLHWILRRLFRNHEKYQFSAGYLTGYVFLTILSFLSMLLGGWLVTLLFNLWASPFARILYF